MTECLTTGQSATGLALQSAAGTHQRYVSPFASQDKESPVFRGPAYGAARETALTRTPSDASSFNSAYDAGQPMVHLASRTMSMPHRSLRPALILASRRLTSDTTLPGGVHHDWQSADCFCLDKRLVPAEVLDGKMDMGVDSAGNGFESRKSVSFCVRDAQTLQAVQEVVQEHRLSNSHDTQLQASAAGAAPSPGRARDLTQSLRRMLRGAHEQEPAELRSIVVDQLPAAECSRGQLKSTFLRRQGSASLMEPERPLPQDIMHMPLMNGEMSMSMDLGAWGADNASFFKRSVQAGTGYLGPALYRGPGPVAEAREQAIGQYGMQPASSCALLPGNSCQQSSGTVREAAAVCCLLDNSIHTCGQAASTLDRSRGMLKCLSVPLGCRAH